MSSNTDQHVVAIAGFTGRMARLITDSLLQKHPDAIVHGIVRNPDKVDKTLRSNPNIKIFQAAADDQQALEQALKGSNICICCYLGDNSMMIEGQKPLVDACIGAGVPRYLASDWAFDYRGLEVGDHPAKDPMVLTHRYVQGKEKAGLIAGVHVLCGALSEVAWAPFVGWVDAEKATFSYYGTGDEPHEFTTMPDASAFTAEVAYDQSAKGVLQIVSDRISLKGMAETYARVYGLEPTIERKGSLDELYKSMKETLKQDPKNVHAWLGPHYMYWMAQEQSRLGSLDNERCPGFEPTTTEDFLRRYGKDEVGRVYRNM